MPPPGDWSTRRPFTFALVGALMGGTPRRPKKVAIFKRIEQKKNTFFLEGFFGEVKRIIGWDSTELL